MASVCCAFAASLSIHPGGRCVSRQAWYEQLPEAPAERIADSRFYGNLKHLIHDAIRSPFADADPTPTCARPAALIHRRALTESPNR